MVIPMDSRDVEDRGLRQPCLIHLSPHNYATIAYSMYTPALNAPASGGGHDGPLRRVPAAVCRARHPHVPGQADMEREEGNTTKCPALAAIWTSRIDCPGLLEKFGHGTHWVSHVPRVPASSCPTWIARSRHHRRGRQAFGPRRWCGRPSTATMRRPIETTGSSTGKSSQFRAAYRPLGQWLCSRTPMSRTTARL